MKYPAPLRPGSRIAITAFSSGVRASVHPRLDLVISDLRSRGFEVIEGQCLRQNHKHVSADAQQRATELMTFLCDGTFDAVVPPWGGERAIELLSLLDFDQLRQVKPKWIFGYSDVSTITAVISCLCGWATAHCANLLDMINAQPDPLTANTLNYLATETSGSFTQYSAEHYQLNHMPFEHDPQAVLNLTEAVTWKALTGQTTVKFSGRLFGGCLDTLQHLVATPVLDLKILRRRFEPEGLLLYFENVELSPSELLRTLYSLKFKDMFIGINGLLIGRNSAVSEDSSGFSDMDVLHQLFANADFPILYDVDIGHRQPNLTLINGALATVTFEHGGGRVQQWLL